MAAGVPYYLRSIVATIVSDVAIVWLLRHAPESLRFYYLQPALSARTAP